MSCIPPIFHDHGILILDQAYYRRGVANSATLQPRLAVKDFQTAFEKDPDNRDAYLKFQESKKHLRQLDFAAAIEVQDEPAQVDSFNFADIAVEDSYDGARLGDEMTQEFIDDMIQRFKDGKKIHRKYVFQIVKQVYEIARAEPPMVEVDVKEGTQLTVCGDTHGMLTFPSRLLLLLPCN